MNQAFKDGENAEYWAGQVAAWLDDNTTLPVPEVVAIAGKAIVEFGDEWHETHVEEVRNCLITEEFPVPRITEQRNGNLKLVLKADDSRLKVPRNA